MTQTLTHRGPDSEGYFVEGSVGLGFRRLSIIDLTGGDQPIYNEDKSLVLLCNGEIFNHQHLRLRMEARGHQFRTNTDVEVLVHLYEEYGRSLLSMLNGQFSFVIYDRKKQVFFLARDHFGITPLFWVNAGGVFIFASEIKAILEHPNVQREVDPGGLDQVLSFPGLISPRTMFKGIQSLKSGHWLMVQNGQVQEGEYWDLCYPTEPEATYEKTEQQYVEELREHLFRSVRYRLQADVPVGFYLSGGLDSSLIGAVIHQISPGIPRHAFSIGFTTKEICEDKYQRLMASSTGSQHHEIIFNWPEISGRMQQMIYHCECPVKETYNTCSMALSQAARAADVPVILTGEGADELFAGYVGYRFDRYSTRNSAESGLEAILEEEMRERLWGDRNLFYEAGYSALSEIKSALYSDQLNRRLPEFDCLSRPLVCKQRLKNRHPVHQRSYLDFHLRLSDHLIADHGDRMALANSVEARYPFLDVELIDFSTRLPPSLKLNDFTEKYILRKVAEGLVPDSIINREKFGFHAPGTPFLLLQKLEWVEDILSYERIRRQGYFNPNTVERLKAQYSKPGFHLNLPFETDLLAIVLTFGIFLDLFKLPCMN